MTSRYEFSIGRANVDDVSALACIRVDAILSDAQGTTSRKNAEPFYLKRGYIFTGEQSLMTGRPMSKALD